MTTDSSPVNQPGFAGGATGEPGAALPGQVSSRGLYARFERATELDMRTVAMVAALVFIWVVMAVATGGIFIKPQNLTNLAVQGSIVAMMATGMVLVIVARHIDLSVGSALAFTGMITAWVQVEFFPRMLGPWFAGAGGEAPAIFGLDANLGWLVGILAALAVGAIIGLWQGYWIAYRGVPSFVVTLAGLLGFRGAAFLVSSGRTIAPLNPNFKLLGGGAAGSIGATASWLVGAAAVAGVIALVLRARAQRRKYGIATKPIAVEWLLIGVYAAVILGFVQVMNSYFVPRTDIPRGIPVPVLILGLVAIIMNFVATRTRFGRYVYAMGGNPEAAELSGIATRRVTVMIFVIMGALAGLAGVVTTARLQSAGNLMGFMQELSVIAAAVIGGTSLAGGTGKVSGAILGALVIFSIENGLTLLGVPNAWRQIFMGLVLIGAVWFDVAYSKLQR